MPNQERSKSRLACLPELRVARYDRLIARLLVLIQAEPNQPDADLEAALELAEQEKLFSPHHRDRWQAAVDFYNRGLYRDARHFKRTQFAVKR